MEEGGDAAGNAEAMDDPLWAEKLVAKARAPVKREFLLSAPNRSSIAASAEADSEAPKISMEKKSKKQLKRERNEAKKSVQNFCSIVAKTGDVNSCSFGAGCRLSHDIAGYLSQKPADVPGQCPFVASKRQCEFGIRCRFFGTHTNVHSARTEDHVEINVLNKEFQKSLWKHTALFPKADEQLKKLGLLNTLKEKFRPKGSNKAVKEESENPATKKPKVCAPAEVPDEETKLTDQTKLTASEETGPDDETKLEDEKEAKPEDEKPAAVNEMEPEADVDNEKAQNCEAEDGHGVYIETKLCEREKKRIEFKGKLYLAPLTTVGNLPFRRLCKQLGADVTCGEMALCSNLLQGQASEWALLRRHAVEDVFGVQICGSHADTLSRTAEIIERECQVDFIDVNVGCPIDIIVNKGAGSCLLTKPTRFEHIVRATSGVLETPLTVKVRTGYFEGRNCVDSMIPNMSRWGASAVTVHGRTRQQRYSKLADWEYIYNCSRQASDELQVLGNGDIFSYVDWNEHLAAEPTLASCMIARGALVKPWLFTEIKEQRHWDISSSERLDHIRDYVRFGLEHWGSDTKGIETTRRFLLEWLSYTHRYIPMGLLEVVPQKLNWRPPNYFGRNDLETLMASDSAADWVRISEMVLGPPPAGFVFTPKHKTNAYDKAENG